MSIRLALLTEAIRSRLWVIPGVAAVAAFITAIALVALDRSLGADVPTFISFDGGAESARSILSTIAAAMLSFTGLVFTVTMLVLQLASSQLSPRVTRTFLRDRLNQIVLGLFVATFVYALLVLREVRSPDPGPEFVPGIATWWAIALLLASIAAFIAYINHMARSIRASSVIASVAGETRDAIERLYPEGVGDGPGEGAVTSVRSSAAARVSSGTTAIDSGDASGVVVAIDDSRLLGHAIDAGVVLEVVPRVGDHVVARSPIVVVRGGAPRSEADDAFLRSTIRIGRERTMEQDAAFGFRQLVDIAERALSPGINDPSTAVLVLDELHDLLRRLIRRRFPASVRLDDAGAVRLILPRPDWSDYLDLALDEIRLYGAGSLQVARRMTRLLDDLLAVAPPDRIATVRQHRAVLDGAIERAFSADHDRSRARQAGRTRPPAQE